MNFFIYCLYILTNCIFIYFCFTNLQVNNIKKIYKILLFFYLITITLFFYHTFGQNLTPIVIVGSAIIITVSDRKHALTNVFLSLTGYLIYVLTNYLFSFCFEILGFSSNKFFDKHPFTTVLLIGLATFFTTFYLGLYLRKKTFTLGFSFPSGFAFLLLLEVLICTAIFIFNIVYGAKYSYPKEIIFFNGTLVIAFFIATMIVFYFVVHLIRKNYNLQLQQKEASQLEEYTNKLENINQEMRVFRHDYMNILSTMNGYLMNNDMPSLRAYFEERILPKGQILSDNNILISRLSMIKIPELKGILYEKLVTAVNLDLAVKLEITEEIEKLEMDTLDLAIVIGNFMDNALEASAVSYAHSLTVLFMKLPDHIHIIIENSTEESISLEELASRDYTTKKGHSGIGLYHVKEILKRYPNVHHDILYQNGIFQQSLKIYQNQKG